MCNKSKRYYINGKVQCIFRTVYPKYQHYIDIYVDTKGKIQLNIVLTEKKKSS